MGRNGVRSRWVQRLIQAAQMGLGGEIEDKMMDWLTGDFGVQVSVCVFVDIWGAC